MTVYVQDHAALRAVSPTSLSAYARGAGWRKLERYGDHSDVYTAEGKPEVIIPRTERLGDYAQVVGQLIGIFAKEASLDHLSVYRALVTTDRDAVRLRVPDGADDGSLPLAAATALVRGAWDLLLAAACSLRRPQAVFRAGANREAIELLRQVRLGQTEQGSFAITLLTPVVPPPMPMLLAGGESAVIPDARRLTLRLREALTAVRAATESASTGDGAAFSDVMERGVSANLCEALDRLIQPFSGLDIGLSWARTRPETSLPPVFRFAKTDTPILREAARTFRNRAPKPDVALYGFVRILKRKEAERDGTIVLTTSLDGKERSVRALLPQADYERALEAHGQRAVIGIKGDLEQVGGLRQLLNPRITAVVRNPTETAA